MIPTHNELRTLVAGIRATGAKIPDDLAALVEHTLDLRPTPSAPNVSAGQAASDLLALVGKPAAFDKALQKAALDLTARETAARIRNRVSERALTHAFTAIRDRAPELSDLVAAQLEPRIATLNAQAHILGGRFTATAESLTNASADKLLAYRAVEDARSVVEGALESMHLLYRPGRTVGRMSVQVWRRLPVIEIPADLEYEAAVKLADAIEGIRLLGSDFSIARHDHDGYWPARVAALGGTFAWANPAETQQRGQRLLAALTPKAEHRAQAVSA